MIFRTKNPSVFSFNFTSTAFMLRGDTAENTAQDLKHYFTQATKTDPRMFSFAPEDL